MSYRHLQVQKKVKGKIKRYRNLATFNKECSKRSTMGEIAMLCSLTNARKLKDGSGMATVRVEGFRQNTDERRGTWLLHFASYDVMKRHLKGRVSGDTKHSPHPMLAGSRRRK